MPSPRCPNGCASTTWLVSTLPARCSQMHTRERGRSSRREAHVAVAPGHHLAYGLELQLEEALVLGGVRPRLVDGPSEKERLVRGLAEILVVGHFAKAHVQLGLHARGKEARRELGSRPRPAERHAPQWRKQHVFVDELRALL